MLKSLTAFKNVGNDFSEAYTGGTEPLGLKAWFIFLAILNFNLFTILMDYLITPFIFSKKNQFSQAELVRTI